jgi:hypothetical protein
VPRLEAGAFETSLPIDECYTATVGGTHYTLVYLKRKVAESTVLRFMVDYGNRQEPARVVECHAWGFSGGSETSGLYEHPSFRVLVEQHRLQPVSGGASYYSWLERPGIHFGGIMVCYLKKAGGGGGDSKKGKRVAAPQQVCLFLL